MDYAKEKPYAALKGPAVSVVLCVSDPKRNLLCRKAVNHFLQTQSYTNYVIVIVNSSGSPVTDKESAEVVEHMVDGTEFAGLAQLRNYGIANSPHDIVMFIDDDDVQHPDRLLTQLAYHVGASGRCVLLKYQTRVDIRNAIAAVVSNNHGLPNTVLFNRKRNDETLRLFSESKSNGIDFDFVEQNFDARVVIDNKTVPGSTAGPLLQICCWHGANQMTRKEFMGEYADVEKYGQQAIGLSSEQLESVLESLRIFNWEAEVASKQATN